MIDRVYSINKKKLYIYCEIAEYCERIENWISIYDEIVSNDYEYYIKIFEDKTIWNLNGSENSIIGKLNHTDLYPLFYNVIFNIISDKNYKILHSVVLYYNDIGILVVGDFNSGKTTLCLEALNNNIDVLSADQTILYYKKDKLFFKKGSNYMKIDDENYTFINKNDKEVEIKYIINLIGICDNGIVKMDLIKDKYLKIKSLFKYFTWHSDIPLFTNNILLDVDRMEIFGWLSKINIPMYKIRGDKIEIIKKIKEILI